jgi:hypothetical protein
MARLIRDRTCSCQPGKHSLRLIGPPRPGPATRHHAGGVVRETSSLLADHLLAGLELEGLLGTLTDVADAALTAAAGGGGGSP